MRKSSITIKDYILPDEKILFHRDITKLSPWIGDIITATMFFIITIIQFTATIGVHAYILEFKTINMLLEIILPILGIIIILDVITRIYIVIGTENRIIFIRKSILKTMIRDVNYDSITGSQISIRWRPLILTGFILLFTYIGISIFGPLLMITTASFNGFTNGIILGLILGIIIAVVEAPYSAIILYTSGTLGRWTGEPPIIKLNPFQKLEKRLKILYEIQQLYQKHREEENLTRETISIPSTITQS